MFVVFALAPKSEVAPPPCWAAPPNSADPAGFELLAGGAPAGVVEGSEKAGLAGVADEASPGDGAAGCEVGVLPSLFPNRPPAGAAAVAGAAGVELAALF